MKRFIIILILSLLLFSCESPNEPKERRGQNIRDTGGRGDSVICKIKD